MSPSSKNPSFMPSVQISYPFYLFPGHPLLLLPSVPTSHQCNCLVTFLYTSRRALLSAETLFTLLTTMSPASAKISSTQKMLNIFRMLVLQNCCDYKCYLNASHSSKYKVPNSPLPMPELSMCLGTKHPHFLSHSILLSVTNLSSTYIISFQM